MSLTSKQRQLLIQHEWLTSSQVAEFFGVTVEYVKYWRKVNRGPAYWKEGLVNAKCRYSREAVLKYWNEVYIDPSEEH